jgi:mannose-6-phosphate isomerase-like protein (cupin superfamily)
MMLALLPWLLTATLAAADATPPVVHLKPSDVASRTAGGDPLIIKSDRYKVMMSERNTGGEAEAHAGDTDVFYILSGSAVFVTGGTVVDARQTAAGETRGASIEGGEVRTLGPGDVLVIPAGTPHWFKSVEGSCKYFVVKVAG